MRKSRLVKNFKTLRFSIGESAILPSLIKFIFIIFFTSIAFYSNGQVLTEYPCYSISEDNAPPNTLFEYDPQSQEWYRIGETGGSFIEAIATDPLTNILYAADGGIFGTVDRTTAKFTPIGSPGSANGAIGLMVLDDIDGLSYDLVNEIMYATQRIVGLGPGTNDLLFQIDVATGKFVPGAMESPNGNSADYAVVESVFENTFGGEVYDVDDIAINPYTSELYAIQNQDGPSVITQIDPVSGKLISVILDFSDDDVEGLGFTYLGELYATTGDNGLCNNDPADNSCYNTFIYIDLVNLQTNILNFIDPTGVEVDFESFDCFTSFNDLALTNKLARTTPELLAPGDQVTFELTVYNQGGFDNHDITLTDYIPEGLILNDADWTKSGSDKATHKINTVLNKEAWVTIPITFKIDENYEGASIINAAEITSSFNPDVDSPVAKRGQKVLMALPDIDSKPDDLNNETNIVNNEIFQGGPNSIVQEDEDDHDIEEIFIQNSACAANLDLRDDIVTSGTYQAGISVSCSALLKTPRVQLLAGKEVVLLSGFSVTRITQFSIDIESCL